MLKERNLYIKIVFYTVKNSIFSCNLRNYIPKLKFGRWGGIGHSFQLTEFKIHWNLNYIMQGSQKTLKFWVFFLSSRRFASFSRFLLNFAHFPNVILCNFANLTSFALLLCFLFCSDEIWRFLLYFQKYMQIKKNFTSFLWKIGRFC